MKASSEKEYYREYAEGTGRIILLAVAMSIIAAIGGLVGGMNTMYASVLSRVREIATLQVLGFTRKDVIVCFVIESLILSLAGCVIGCAAGLGINGLPTKLAMGAFALEVDWTALCGGAGIALFIGVIGALPPALRAVRMKIPEALRYC